MCGREGLPATQVIEFKIFPVLGAFLARRTNIIIMAVVTL